MAVQTAALHPSAQVLAAYGTGKLNDAEAEVVLHHLETCTECQQRVATVSADSFVVKLRDAQDRADTVPPGHSQTDSPGSAEKAKAPTAKAPAQDAPTVIPPELAQWTDYEVLRELGRGGMGVVYLARNKLMDRLEVLKVLNKSLLEKSGAVERFLREIRSAARLQHSNVVAAYRALQAGDLLAFAMEYVEGEDLAQLVRDRGPLPVANACYYTYQAAFGLQHAHEKKMVHRDIKPGNLILARDGKKHIVKVLDFGLAKASMEKPLEGALTGDGQMLGTPDYVAPEQTLNAATADIRADIYSLGCTLYYLLSGGPPFRGSNLYEILNAHQLKTAKPLNEVRPEVPIELAAIVARMMAKDPAKRYQTPAAAAQALAPFIKAGAPKDGGLRAEVVVRTKPETDLDTAAPKKAAPAEDQWSSLADFSITESDSRPAKKKRAALGKSAVGKRWLWPGVAVGVVVLGLLVLWAAGGFAKTKDGTIVLENLPDNAKVLVDGKDVIVTWDGGGKSAHISVKPGTHKIVATTGGVTVIGEEVAIEEGGRKVLTARLIPPPTLELAISPSLTLDAGQTVTLKVTITRRHCKGPIELRLEGLPDGVQAPSTRVSADASSGEIRLTARANVTAKIQKVRVLAVAADARTEKSFELTLQPPVVPPKIDPLSPAPSFTVFAPKCTIESSKALVDLLGGDRSASPVRSAKTLAEATKPDSSIILLVMDEAAFQQIGEYSPNLLKNRKVIGIGFGAAKLFGELGLEWAVACAHGFAPPGAPPSILVQQNKLLDSSEFKTAFSLFEPAVLDPKGHVELVFGVYLGVKAPKVRRDLVEVIALETNNANYASVARQGNYVLVGVDAQPDKWSPNLRRLIQSIGIALHAKDLNPNLNVDPGTKPDVDLGSGVQMKFARVPKGKFWMGGGGGKAGTKQEEVGEFEMGVFEVTQAQWKAVMGANNNPSHFKGDDLPVEKVSWNDTKTYIAKLNEKMKGSGYLYRLPTEMEWEYACRGAPTTEEECKYDFYFDKPTNALTSNDANFDGNHPTGGAAKSKYLRETVKVGSYKRNKLGLYDMHGNVAEWCEDLHDGGPHRVLRGGCWEGTGSSCTAAYRPGKATETSRNHLGFRLARVPVNAKSMPTTAAPDRRAAEWVLSIGGTIKIKEDGEERRIMTVGDLPRGAFELTVVGLENNAKVTDAGLAQFRGCKNLTALWLGTSQGRSQVSDTGLAYFKDCKNLTNLNLFGTQVSNAGLAYFKDCKNLTELYLQYTKVGDVGLAHFKDCKNLTRLCLPSTQVSDAGLANFKECKNLRVLELCNTQVTNEGMAHCKNWKSLGSLHLNDTRIGDAGLAQLEDCKDLTWLTLNRTKVTAEGVAKLKKALPKCKIEH